MHGPVAAVYDWLAANGIREWLPENPVIVVADNRIVFSAFVWTGPPGWDPQHIHPDFDTVTRTVPLQVPPSPRVAETLTEMELFATLHGRAPVVR